MITTFKIKSLMGPDETVSFENGVVLQKTNKFNAVIVMKTKDFDIQWIESFENLPDKGKELIYKMLKARKVMLSFDTEFNIVTKGIVIDKPEKAPKHYES